MSGSKRLRTDVESAIRYALKAQSSAVTIQSLSMNERGTAAHVRFTYKKDRLFAKILLQERTPKMVPTFMLVASESQLAEWTATEQIQRECERGEQMRALAATFDGVAVPSVRALSETARTIVWDEARGRTFGQTLKSLWSSCWAREKATRVIRRLGHFLGVAHATFANGSSAVQLVDAASALNRFQKQYEHDIGSLETFEQIVADLQAEVRKRNVWPATVVHGDWSLANLLWDESRDVVSVVDFEHSRVDVTLFDVIAWVYGVRVALLRPWVSKHIAWAWETEFWKGYSMAAKQDHPELCRLAQLCAAAWVFAHVLSERLPARERNATGLRRLQFAAYRKAMVSRMVTARLEALTWSLGKTLG